MLYLQALWQPGVNRFAFSPFGNHAYVQVWSTASPSIASPPQVCCCLCSCSTDKPGQTDQKPKNGVLRGLSKGILEIPYCHALRLRIRTWLALVKLGDLMGKGSHVVGLITLSSTLILVLSGKKPWTWNVFNVQRRLIPLQRQNLQWSTVCVPFFFPSAVYQ